MPQQRPRLDPERRQLLPAAFAACWTRSALGWRICEHLDSGALKRLSSLHLPLSFDLTRPLLLFLPCETGHPIAGPPCPFACERPEGCDERSDGSLVIEYA